MLNFIPRAGILSFALSVCRPAAALSAAIILRGGFQREHPLDAGVGHAETRVVGYIRYGKFALRFVAREGDADNPVGRVVVGVKGEHRLAGEIGISPVQPGDRVNRGDVGKGSGVDGVDDVKQIVIRPPYVLDRKGLVGKIEIGRIRRLGGYVKPDDVQTMRVDKKPFLLSPTPLCQFCTPSFILYIIYILCLFVNNFN